MTPAERKALTFLAAVAALGAGARAAGVGTPPPPVAPGDPAAEERGALARQLAAVDSARASRRPRARSRGARPERTAAASGSTLPATTASSATASGATVALTPQRSGADTRRRGRATGTAPVGPVDVDRADSAALVVLPGVGPALARRIVADRAARGPFGTIDGLSRVPGVGPRLEERLRPWVVFSGRPAAPGPP
jgi:competence protein ComEA